MANKNQKEIFVPKGYDLEEILDVEEEDFDLGQPILCEEVKLIFEWYKKNNLWETYSPKENACGSSFKEFKNNIKKIYIITIIWEL